MGRRRPGPGDARRGLQRERGRAAGDELTARVPEPEREHHREPRGIRRDRAGDDDADQARRVPHQGEPDVRSPLRHVPGRERGLDGDGVRAAADAHARDRRPGARRPAALLHVRARGVGPGRDGRVPAGRPRPVGLHAAPQGPAAELLALGAAERPVRQLLRERAGPLVPEPPLLDRRHLGRRARQPATDAEPHPRLQHVRLRRASAADRRGLRQRGAREEGAPVLRLPHRGRPAEPRADPVGPVRGERGPEGLHLVGVRGCSHPSRGSRRGSSCPNTPNTTSATARTGPRR